MADQKKIIKVNDLTIQAENVHFEPIVREGRPVHPFFGPRPSRRVMPSQPVQPAQSEQTEDTDNKDDEATETEVQTEEQPEQEQQDRRPPFSWL